VRIPSIGGLLLALAACGSGGSGLCGASPAPAATVIPIDHLIAEEASADCKLYVRCAVASDQALCSTWLSSLIASGGSGSLAADLAAVKAGRSIYDPVAAESCVQAVAEASCSVIGGSDDGSLEVCQKVFAGTQALGSACAVDAECTPGDYCWHSASTSSSTCMGICAQGGDSCNQDAQCPSGQVCDTGAGTASPKGACAVPLPGEDNQPCGTNDACPDGSFCAFGNDGSICLPLAAAGQPCVQQGCVEGYVCARSSGAADATCVKPAGKGGACVSNSQCGSSFVSALACDPTSHTCVEAPSSGPCLANRCNILTSYCDPSGPTPTCKPYLALGTSCQDDAQCGLSGGFCRSSNPASTMGTCVVPTACD